MYKEYEKSCGAVIYCRQEDGIKYLLACERSGFWVFPKGHMEDGETEEETALREVKEETGLDVTLVEGFCMKDEHNLAREGRPNTIKQTIYFLASYSGQHYVMQESEVREIALLDYEEAMARLQLDSFKHILAEVHAFLEKEGV